jgi:hypothetical protein
VGEHHQRDGAAKGARRNLAELALHLCRERRPSARQGTVRPQEAARLPRPLRRRRRAAARGAAAGAGELRQRPEPGGGADQQGDDRDPAEVRRQAAGESRCAKNDEIAMTRLEGRAGPRRGRALLRPVDARRGGEAHRPPLPQGRGHRRDGEGAAGPEALRRPEAHRHRLAVGAHGEEPQPGLRQGGRAARLDLHALHQGGQGSVRRAGDRGGGYRFTVKVGKPKDAEAAKNGTKLARGANFKCLMSGTPMLATTSRPKARRAHGRAADGDRCRGRSRAVYLTPTPEHEAAAARRSRSGSPEVDYLPVNDADFKTPTADDIRRPLHPPPARGADDLLRPGAGARERVKRDALAAGLPDDPKAPRDGGTGATAYAEAVGVYLAFAWISRLARIALELATACRGNQTSTLSFGDKRCQWFGTLQRRMFHSTWRLGYKARDACADGA